MVGVLVEHVASLYVDTARIRAEPLQWVENADARMSLLQLRDDRAKLRLPGLDRRALPKNPSTTVLIRGCESSQSMTLEDFWRQ